VFQARCALDADSTVAVAGFLPDRAPGQRSPRLPRQYLSVRPGPQEHCAHLLKQPVGGEEHAARIRPGQVHDTAPGDHCESVIERMHLRQRADPGAAHVRRRAQNDCWPCATGHHRARRERARLHGCELRQIAGELRGSFRYRGLESQRLNQDGHHGWHGLAPQALLHPIRLARPPGMVLLTPREPEAERPAGWNRARFVRAWKRRRAGRYGRRPAPPPPPWDPGAGWS